jgi:hypothetical protein
MVGVDTQAGVGDVLLPEGLDFTVTSEFDSQTKWTRAVSIFPIGFIGGQAIHTRRIAALLEIDQIRMSLYRRPRSPFRTPSRWPRLTRFDGTIYGIRGRHGRCRAASVCMSSFYSAVAAASRWFD